MYGAGHGLRDSGDVPDYAALWMQLRGVVGGDAEYAKEGARRARRVRNDEEVLDFHRYSGEADAFARMLSLMDEMAPEAAP
jgi:hypothetical protein